MIAGLDSPDMGELVVGETVKCMYVDQNREGLDNPELSVYDAVTDGAEEIQLGPRTINRLDFWEKSDEHIRTEQDRTGTETEAETDQNRTGQTVTQRRIGYGVITRSPSATRKGT